MPVDLTKRWALGFKDRGLGHGDFAVIEKLPEGNCPEHGLTPTLVVETESRELAEHLIKLHNQSLASTRNQERSCCCEPGDPCDYHAATCVTCGDGHCQGHPTEEKDREDQEPTA